MYIYVGSKIQKNCKARIYIAFVIINKKKRELTVFNAFFHF